MKDKTIQKIVKEVAEEEGLTEETINEIMSNVFSWSRIKLSEMENVGLRWTKFGSFDLRTTHFKRQGGEASQEYIDAIIERIKRKSGKDGNKKTDEGKVE